MKKIMFVTVIVLLLFSCSSPQRTNLTGYTLSPTPGNAGEFLPPKEVGGRIEIGGNGQILGNSSSKATKTFVCGNRDKCKIQIAVGGGPGNNQSFKDGEEILIVFSWGNNQSSSDTYGTSERYPQYVELPTCGEITVTISMTEGNNPGLESWANISPLVYWCKK
jgi:hypothetical protein